MFSPSGGSKTRRSAKQSRLLSPERTGAAAAVCVKSMLGFEFREPLRLAWASRLHRVLRSGLTAIHGQRLAFFRPSGAVALCVREFAARSRRKGGDARPGLRAGSLRTIFCVSDRGCHTRRTPSPRLPSGDDRRPCRREHPSWP